MQCTRCDLCGADDTEVLLAGDGWGQHLPVDIAMVRCRRCGLVYLNPRPAPEEIGAFYPPDYGPFQGAIEDEPHAVMRWLRRRKLADRRRLVERYAGRRAGRVLDVGCSTGLFLHEMALAGWEAQGVELTPSAAAYARQRFGLDVFEGMLEEAPFADASFDTITFWDVLEHTYSPSATLAHVARLLKPGGLVAINIPNWDSPDRRLFGPYWVGYDPPRHLYVFTRKTLGALLEQAGFAPLDWRCFMPSYFTFVYSVQYWLQAKAPRWAGPVARGLRFPGVRLPFEPLFALANRLGKGGVIAVFARKAEAGRPQGSPLHITGRQSTH